MAFESEADKVLQEAQKALFENRTDIAEQRFNYLLDRNRNSGELWYYLGTCALQRKHFTHSVLLFRQALALDGGMISAYNNLGVAYKGLGLIDKAQESFDKALTLFPEAGFNPIDKGKVLGGIGGMYTNNGTPAKAIEYLEQARALAPEEPTVLFNLSLAYLEAGRWAEGWDLYDHGARKDKTYGNLPIWDGSPGKRVVVYGEQGIGDEIMFASIIPDLLIDCESVIVDAHPRLQNMFQRSFKNLQLPIYGTRKQKDPKWVNHQRPDARIAMGSLGRLYRRQDSDFPREPYLKADPELVDEYRQKLAHHKRPRIGIAWKGGYVRTHKDERSMSVDDLLGVVSGIGEVWSLQYTPEAAAACAGKPIHHWQAEIDNYDLTAALVANLDLVITVNQSLAHLCGAMGVDNWVLTPKACAWRYGTEGERMPFYGPWSRQFRQGDDRSWAPVLERVRGELWKRFPKTIAA